jgi:hypothetical protein
MSRRSLTIKIDSELLDKIKDIVYNEYGYTINVFVEDILREYLKDKYDNIPKRPTENLRPGRKYPDTW